MKRAALIVILVLLGGCGGSNGHQKPAAHPGAKRAAGIRLARQCPANAARMGCAIARPAPTIHPKAGRPPAGALFPDVYEGQGAVNWQAVKTWQQQHGWKPAAIFKLGEFRIDSQALRNAAQTRALGFWRAGYWFVRNTGCSTEARQVLQSARTLQLVVVALDLEVPEAAGYGQCLSPILRRAGLIVIEYTAPGTNPGGVDTADPLWIATYGPSFGCIWTCRPTAWQFTDGVFNAPVAVPGIPGADDVNVDLGITRLGAPAPDPYAKYPKPVRSFQVRGGTVRASEYNTVRTWDRAGCRQPARRKVCTSSSDHLGLLLGRINFLAHHVRSGRGWREVRARWSSDQLGSRAAGIRTRLH